jgi:hypothetical protein
MFEPLFECLQEHRRWRIINDTMVNGKVQVHHEASFDEPGATTGRSATRPTPRMAHWGN